MRHKYVIPLVCAECGHSWRDHNEYGCLFGWHKSGDSTCHCQEWQPKKDTSEKAAKA